MVSRAGRLPAGPARRGGRAVAAVVAAGVGVGGLAACGEGPTGPVDDPAATGDLQRIGDTLDALEERIGELEDRRSGAAEPTASAAPTTGEEPAGQTAQPDDAPASPSGAPVEDAAGLFENPEPLIGEDVMVTAPVSALVGVADVGAVFRIGDGTGTTVAVVMVTPPPELQTGDVVQVSGTVGRVAESSFEADFGIAADVLTDDPQAFFGDLAGDVAIAADRVTLVQEQAG
ncbi:hypothetical protein [Blastococcus sp. SYSU DS0973]